jgi:predicted  nucleic acid-binding Zn-ribbon protein
MKSMCYVLVMGLLAGSGLSQTNKSDSQTQQQILDELRAIHRDFEANTALQLLLAELQIAQTSLDHATQRRDTLKAQVAQLQADQTAAQADVARFESGMEKVANPDQQLVETLQELKDRLRKVTVQEMAASEQLQDAENRLRTAEAQRESVQDQLSELMKKLSAAS